MTYDELVQYYLSKVPQDPAARIGTDAGNNRFNEWTAQLERELGIPGGEYNDPSSGWAGITPAQLDDFEVQGGNSTATNVPLEQGILQTVLPRLTNDINDDAGRRTLATGLANQAITGTQGAATALQRTQGGGFDGRTYLAQNPDVAEEFERQRQANPALDLNTFAEQHYLQFGQREGRQPAYIQSAQLAQDFNNANQTTAANIAALQTATTAMQQNLTGNLAAKAAALQQQIATLNDNIGTLDAAQRQALATQIASMQANLDQEIGTQRQALTDQLAALGNNASAEAAARRAALQQEIAGLTAAQAPLNEARLKSAELQATGINVGLERTKDQLTAEAAKQGFIGGSTVQDAALARATIGARQGAAEAMGNARVANATDTRDIGFRGATGERSIADALAGRTREIGDYGAGTNFQLTSNLATGRRQIGDYGAAGTAGITNNTATNRFNVGNYGANTTYGNAVFGADQGRSIADALAQGTAAQTLAGNAAKATYYDNDFGRRVSSGLALGQIPAGLAQTLTGLDNYSNSGLNRTLNTLNWWSTNGGTAPTPGYTQRQPSNSGNDLSGLGNGLVSLAGSYGQANNWWRTPTTVPRTTTPGGVNAGGSNLYTSPLT